MPQTSFLPLVAVAALSSGLTYFALGKGKTSCIDTIDKVPATMTRGADSRGGMISYDRKHHRFSIEDTVRPDDAIGSILGLMKSSSFCLQKPAISGIDCDQQKERCTIEYACIAMK